MRNYRSRLRVLRSKIRGAEEVEIGGGRRIRMTPQQRYDTLIDALAGEDTEAIQAIRSGRGGDGEGKFASLINAFDPAHRVPPSGDPENPWVDEGGASPAEDIAGPGDIPGRG